MNTNLFPVDSAIPPALRIDKPLEQREYLIAGELRRWDGELNAVLSPVFVKTAKGYEQQLVGHTPLLTPNEAMAALDATSLSGRSSRTGSQHSHQLITFSKT